MSSKTRFHSILEERIQEQLNKRAEELSKGVDVEHYREQVGYCNGLRDALVIADDVEKEFDA